MGWSWSWTSTPTPSPLAPSTSSTVPSTCSSVSQLSFQWWGTRVSGYNQGWSTLLTSLPQLSPPMASGTSHQNPVGVFSLTKAAWISTRATHSPTADWSAGSKMQRRSTNASHGIFPRWVDHQLQLQRSHTGRKLNYVRPMDITGVRGGDAELFHHLSSLSLRLRPHHLLAKGHLRRIQVNSWKKFFLNVF